MSSAFVSGGHGLITLISLRRGHTGTLNVGTLPSITAVGFDGFLIKLTPAGTPTWAIGTATGTDNQNVFRTTVLPDGSFYILVSSGSKERVWVASFLRYPDPELIIDLLLHGKYKPPTTPPGLELWYERDLRQ